MEIEQETTPRLDGKRHPTGEYTLWIDQDELNLIVQGLSESLAPLDNETLDQLLTKLEPYTTDGS